MRKRTLVVTLLSLSWSVGAPPLSGAPAAMGQGTGTADGGKIFGLWKASKRFVPELRGTLTLLKDQRGYVADIAGRRIPVQVRGKRLTFAAEGERGTFSGAFRGGDIVGSWIRPATAVNSSRYASPVHLRREGANRWTGTVEPLQDEFTFYLLARKKADGTIGATLSNPERDLGSQQGVDQLKVSNNEVTLIGHRGGKERTLATGTYSADGPTFTLSFPNRGGTYDFTRDDDFSNFYPRGKSAPRYAYLAPPALRDGWKTSGAEEEGISRREVEKLVQNLSETNVDEPSSLQLHALLIARHGKLVVEEYFHGHSRDRLHETRSAAKSIVSVLMGAAMHSGTPIGLSTPVYQSMGYPVPVQGLDRLKSKMQVRHLLTMSSGFFCDDANEAAPGNETLMMDQTEEPDWYRYTLAVPLSSEPGTLSVYCSANPNLELGVLGRLTGEFVPETFVRLVAEPMRIHNFAWPLDPAGNPYGGGSVQFLPRDFLKFGQLMLNGGTWQGKQILTKQYVANSTGSHCRLAGIHYGFHWWIEEFPYKGRMVRAFMASGAGGQTLTVIPELDLVVATLAGNYASRPGLWLGHEFVAEKVLPAVREAGDDPNATAATVDYQSPNLRPGARPPSTCDSLQ